MNWTCCASLLCACLSLSACGTPGPAKDSGPASPNPTIASDLIDLYESVRADALDDRRFDHAEYWSVLEAYVGESVTSRLAGTSVEGRPIYHLTFGDGPISILLWSQMHGNESTASMALVDVIRFLTQNPNHPLVQRLAAETTIHVVPMLNPDGAERFQRRNAQGIDVNRDARRLATPEGQTLKAVRDLVEPDFGFNLHDQDSRIRVGDSDRPAAISLLAPAFNEARDVDDKRRRAMQVASLIIRAIEPLVGGHVAKYDDSFNPRAFGDLMGAWGASTILIESGGWANDPQKQHLRKTNFVAILSALDGIASRGYENYDPNTYESLAYNGRRPPDLLVTGGTVTQPGRWSLRSDVLLNYDRPLLREGPRIMDLGDLEGTEAQDTLNLAGKFLIPGQLSLDEMGALSVGAPGEFQVSEDSLGISVLGRIPGFELGISNAPISTTQALGTHAPTPEQRYWDWTSLDFSVEEYQNRRTRLLAAMSEEGLDIVLIPSAEGTSHGPSFRQLDDFHYWSGLELPASMLLLDARTGVETIFAPRRDPRFENPGRPNDFPGRPLGADSTLESESGVSLEDVEKLEPFLASLPPSTTVGINLGLSGSVEGVGTAMFADPTPEENLTLHLRAILPQLNITNAFRAVARVRATKSPAEIVRIRRVARLTEAAIERAARRVRPGVDERSLEGWFELGCKLAGAQRIPFHPIIKSGPNSLWPWRILASHYDRRNRSLEPGEVVIFDVGCELDHYVSDVGRTFPVSGDFTDEQQRALEIQETVSRAIIDAIRPGVTLAEVQEVAHAAIPDEARPYMQTGSFFSHHLGLSTGDPVLTDLPLEVGMVFTVEPWYYNHDRGVSVFLEDMILVTADGGEILTDCLPRKATELESLMRGGVGHPLRCAPFSAP